MDYLTSDPSILQIWTDGAINIHSEKLPGGWSFVCVYKKMLIDQAWAGVAPTTSQRMELTAALEALTYIYKAYVTESHLNRNSNLMKLKSDIKEIEILSDSAYLVNAMVQMWYVNRIKNDWKSLVDWQPIKNRDIWEPILKVRDDLEQAGYKIWFRKVKGHKGLLYNEVADKLAVKGKLSVS
jgi:ribonuclease HI